MKTIRPFTVFFMSVLFALSLGAGCEADNRADEPDLEEQQWIYLLLTNPTLQDVTSTCHRAINGALSCANTAGGGGAGGAIVQGVYVAVLEVLYGVTIAAPQGAEQVCSAAQSSSNFPVPGATSSGNTYSLGAINCFLKCEEQFWENAPGKGLCADSTIFSSLVPSDDITYKECLNGCLVGGTILPPPPSFSFL